MKKRSIRRGHRPYRNLGELARAYDSILSDNPAHAKFVKTVIEIYGNPLLRPDGAILLMEKDVGAGKPLRWRLGHGIDVMKNVLNEMQGARK